MHAAAIFLCAGRGTRMRAAADDKVLAPLGGRPVFLHPVAAFLESGVASTFVFVFRTLSQRRKLERAVRTLRPPLALRIIWTRGGIERQDSVANGLDALPPEIEFVFIHDAARPLVGAPQIRRLASHAQRHGSAVLAHRATDTLKELPDESDPAGPRLLRTVVRDRLWAMETPQVFRRADIAAAYAEVQKTNRRVTDDAQAMELAGRPVSLYENPEPNPKLTTPRDLAFAEFLWAAHAARQGRPLTR